ncbi:MAG: hypothetical protein RLO21_17785, partial [Nitratireductor sp.]
MAAGHKKPDRGAKNLTGAQKLEPKRTLWQRSHATFAVMTMPLFTHRDDVFVAGGQPTITYVDREETHIERQLARAIATPNQIVSLSGATKTGKTVLCRKVLGKRQFVWIDGGQIASADGFWSEVRGELSIPDETEFTRETGDTITGGADLVITMKGSHLSKTSLKEKRSTKSLADTLSILIKEKIAIVIDDFHYLNEETRRSIVRNIKGAVFNGLKVVLLSVTHRVFDAIEAETELTGRFTSIILPEWSLDDLKKIPEIGFHALNVECPTEIIENLGRESQENPFLMQKFCWEICFDCGIEEKNLIRKQRIPDDYNIEEMFVRIAKDAGLPIYKILVAGPQSRKQRAKRPLADGGNADIYEATMLALAGTGPKSTISYEELRSELGSMLSDK